MEFWISYGAVVVYVYLLLLAVMMVQSYLLPDVYVLHTRTVFDAPASNDVALVWLPPVPVSKSKVKMFTPLISTLLIESGEVPVFLTVRSMYTLFVPQDLEVNCSSSVLMNVKVSAPIHAATAMLTATVTAISMMAATTGLRAFLLLTIFHIFYTIPP